MAIELNDNIYSKSPKPLDAKAYVGTGQKFASFQTIPQSYRFVGMIVCNVDDFIHWQLQGGIANSNWVQLNTGSGGGGAFVQITTTKIVNAVMDETVFTIPSGCNESNSIIFVNGIETDDYSFAARDNGTQITMGFPLEVDDILTVKKY